MRDRPFYLTLRHVTFVLVALTSILLMARPEICQFFWTRYLGGAEGDAGLYIWLTRSFIQSPTSALLYDSNAMFPYPSTRAWSDNYFLPSALAYLWTQLGLSEVAAYNVGVCLALVLNGASIYLLSRTLALPQSWALCAGICVELSSAIMGNLGHPQLIHFYWIPFSWIPWISGRYTCRSLLLSGISISGAFYCSVYYSIFALAGVLLLAPYTCQSSELRSSRWASIKFLAAFGAGLVLIVPSAIPYVSVRSAFGARQLFEPSYFAAAGLSYLSFSDLNWLFGASATLSHGEAFLASSYTVVLGLFVYFVATAMRSGSVSLRFLCLFVTMLLVGSSVSTTSAGSEYLVCVCTWIVLVLAGSYLLRQRHPLYRLVWVCCVFFVLSLGPGGNPIKHEPAWAPFTLFFAAFPGFESIRASGRLGLVPCLLVFPVAFYIGYIRLRNRLSTRFLHVAPIVLAALICAENWLKNIPVDALQVSPPIFNLLRSKEVHNHATLILPFSPTQEGATDFSWSRFATLQTLQMNWSLDSGARIVNGYSGQRSRLQEELIREMKRFPSQEGISLLHQICGLRYVVVIPSMIPNWNRPAFEAALTALSPRPIVAGSDDLGNLLLDLGTGLLSHSKESPFYAPRKVPIMIEVAATPESAPSCPTTIKIWNKVDGAVVQRAVHSFNSMATPTVVHLPPQSDAAGIPTIISSESPQCAVMTSCELADSL